MDQKTGTWLSPSGDHYSVSRPMWSVLGCCLCWETLWLPPRQALQQRPFLLTSPPGQGKPRSLVTKCLVSSLQGRRNGKRRCMNSLLLNPWIQETRHKRTQSSSRNQSGNKGELSGSADSGPLRDKMERAGVGRAQPEWSPVVWFSGH